MQHAPATSPTKRHPPIPFHLLTVLPAVKPERCEQNEERAVASESMDLEDSASLKR